MHDSTSPDSRWLQDKKIIPNSLGREEPRHEPDVEIDVEKLHCASNPEVSDGWCGVNKFSKSQGDSWEQGCVEPSAKLLHRR
jgi:hypothetical protein